ncbi:S41 family peptidase [Albibacterium indicum]|uniref:S41 family peptidase n=1 Tax=Albibacterium indicum TaxID=2292082 RepID=UPI000E477228|nr:S41 family peptidase [Pedobacter indicus]
MKISYLTLIKRYIPILFMGIAISFASCEKTAPSPTDDTEETEVNPENQKVNEWITEQMRIYYYWNDGIPADNRLDFGLEPPEFFETILNADDRFSWIQKADELNEGMQGVTTSTGMNIILFGYDDGKKVFGVVKYVIPGSPADKAKLERGDMFTKVNGSEMTAQNYEEKLKPYSSGEAFNITLATLKGKVLTTTDETVSLTATKVDEPSVHYHSTITSKSGKKVGYIFYNRFLNNKVDELFDVFAEFKSAGVSDLILDLRYNLGGGIAVSGALSALIMDNYNKEDVFVKYNYNDRLNQQFDRAGQSRDERFYDLYPALSKDLPENPSDQELTAAANAIDARIKAANLNLPRVFILATDNSASASELVIHNLAPYMEVIHIGGTTIGKNEGSITIEDDRKPRQIDWAIQPIIVKLADKEGHGDYDKGLAPDEEIDEYEYLPLSPLGSKEDPLVLTALYIIDPSEATTSQAKQMSVSRAQTRQAAFELIEEFKRENSKPLPVLLDKYQVKPTVIDQLKMEKESRK